jgi:ribosomal protein L11 methyltransferase
MPGVYYRLSITAPATLAERVLGVLARLGHGTLEERPSEQGVCLLVYDTERALLERLRVALEADLARQCPGVSVGFAVDRVDGGWELAWTEHLEPVQLTASLRTRLVEPCAERPPEGELWLLRAFAFGFGEHASTRLMARWLEQCCARRKGVRVLDVGTGTGILAMLAAQSGAALAVGVDSSEDARAAARQNALQNGLEGRCCIEDSALEALGTFDVVVANIEANVLAELGPAIVARLHAGSELALAGFIAEQSLQLCSTFGHMGIALELCAREGEWVLCAGSKCGPA